MRGFRTPSHIVALVSLHSHTEFTTTWLATHIWAATGDRMVLLGTLCRLVSNVIGVELRAHATTGGLQHTIANAVRRRAHGATHCQRWCGGSGALGSYYSRRCAPRVPLLAALTPNALIGSWQIAAHDGRGTVSTLRGPPWCLFSQLCRGCRFAPYRAKRRPDRHLSFGPEGVIVHSFNPLGGALMREGLCLTRRLRSEEALPILRATLSQTLLRNPLAWQTPRFLTALVKKAQGGPHHLRSRWTYAS